MGSLLFVVGSALGAVVAWIANRRVRSRSTIAALNGVVGGLIGMLTSVGAGMAAPAVEVGLGLLTAAAPLTLCIAPVGAGASIVSGLRRLTVTLALSLAYGTGCAAVGFVVVHGVRYVCYEQSKGKAAPDPGPVSPGQPGSPSAISRGRL